MFVTKKKYDQMCRVFEEDLRESQSFRESLIKENQELLEKVESLEKKLEAEKLRSDTDSVTIEFSDDFRVATPKIKYKSDTVEALVQMGIIRETGNEKQDGFQVQLALLDLAKDALLQILEAFEEDVSDDD